MARTGKDQTRHRSLAARIIRGAALALNIALALGLLASAYCGYIPASTWRVAPLAVMSFGAWLAAIVAMLVADLLWWRKWALIALAAMAACAPMIGQFAPMHIPHGRMDDEQKARSFTLMEYNVMQFANMDKDYPFDTNEQLDYILGYSPDIVCLEEARCFSPNGTKITQEQLQEVSEDYRYIYIDGEDLGLLSKFDTHPVHTDFENDSENGSMGVWRMKIHGQVVNVFVVHLRSMKLSKDEKQIFAEATNMETTSRAYIDETKTDILPKVAAASQIRERQIDNLIKYIEKYGGDNVIVCGDFNDPVGSYGLNRLMRECHLKSAYAETGLGPMITYYAHHMWFRIDHILYRGAMAPWEVKRGSITASDHYPLFATFIMQ